MVFSVFGEDRLSRFNIQIGQEIQVFFDIDAREYNGRWFNSIRAYDVRQVDPATLGNQPFAPAPVPTAIGTPAGPPVPAADAAPAAPASDAPFAAPAPAPEGESTDDLPF